MAKKNYNLKAHREWRQKVLDRDNNDCQICHNAKKLLTAHHLIPENFEKYKYDVDNGLTLCPGCHTLARYSAHKHPIWFTNWLKVHRYETYVQVVGRILDA